MPHYRVAQRHNLQDGVMKQVTAGETELLLVQLAGHIYALHAHCTHYGAPLAQGALSGDRLICPWHHACFSARTGALLEPPALDDLPAFPVTLEGDAISVELPDTGSDTELDTVPDSRPPEPSRHDGADTRVFVILGGGAAGATAAETLRREGFGGRVVLVSEGGLPYDRTLLSKDYLGQDKTMGWIPLRDVDFYAQHDIELRLGERAKGLDTQTLHFENGETLSYDALLLATGSAPQPLDVPGTDLAGVHYLRTFENAQAIIAATKAGSRAVVIGSSFIGLETAASLRERGLEVTVVMPEAVPFAPLLGPVVGEVFAALHRDKGVTLLGERKAAQLTGAGRIERVVLDDRTVLETDLVVIGVGVNPVTDVLEDTLTNDDGSVTVDASLRVTGATALYAAGDLARYPDPHTGEPVRVEHWRVAMQQGRDAARAMLGHDTRFSSVPVFWTKQFGISLRYVGHAAAWDEVIISGDLAAREFIAYYLRGGRLEAAAGVGRDADLAAAEVCFALDRLPDADALRQGDVDWRALASGL